MRSVEADAEHSEAHASQDSHHPVTVARATIALDVLSGGRIDLGVGVGRTADQAMAGMLDMSDAERVARLEEGVTVLDRLLRCDHTPFAGRFAEYQQAQTELGCVQAPRPPRGTPSDRSRRTGLLTNC